MQTAVATKDHLIVAHEVTNIGNDRSQLSNMARQAKEATEREALTVIADRVSNGGVNVGQRAGGRAGRFAAGIEHDAPVRPGGDGRGFAAGAGPGVQEAG